MKTKLKMVIPKIPKDINISIIKSQKDTGSKQYQSNDRSHTDISFIGENSKVKKNNNMNGNN